MDTETWKEGGENHFEHTLPGRRKFSSPLTLKRGLLTPGKSGLTDWCNNAFVHLKLKPLALVSVELLDENHKVLAKWDLEHVWPKSWKVAELNAERSEVLIETPGVELQQTGSRKTLSGDAYRNSGTGNQGHCK